MAKPTDLMIITKTAPKSQPSKAKPSTDAVAKTFNLILEYAVKSRASDIHIEPRAESVPVRFRIDGVLREVMTLPKPILPTIISHIKELAKLKVDELHQPQEGRFRFAIGQKTIALRVSTLPIMDGENLVMRLADESTRALTLEELGFETHSLEVVRRNLQKPRGLTIITGPTGSGKSTTLYSMVSLLTVPGANIATIEDPVEYRLPGINQTQVNQKTGITFATGLRALLRQDTNTIMVGEIRDSETAELASQASFSGHVVLSTLPTNSAAAGVSRLLDMGVEPFMISSTLNQIIGQRLIRRLCQTCRVAYTPDSAALEKIKRDFSMEKALERYSAPPPAPKKNPKASRKVIQPLHKIVASKSILDEIAADPNILNRTTINPPPATIAPPQPPAAKKEPGLIFYGPGKGCDQCGGGAYIGQLGIHEVLEVDEGVRRMIAARASTEEIQAAGAAAGMLSLRQDGFLKILHGLSTVEEVLRVT